MPRAFKYRTQLRDAQGEVLQERQHQSLGSAKAAALNYRTGSDVRGTPTGDFHVVVLDEAGKEHARFVEAIKQTDHITILILAGGQEQGAGHRRERSLTWVEV